MNEELGLLMAFNVLGREIAVLQLELQAEQEKTAILTTETERLAKLVTP